MPTVDRLLLADLARGRAGGVDAVVVAPALDETEATDADCLVGAVLLGFTGRLAGAPKAPPVVGAVVVRLADLGADPSIAVCESGCEAPLVLALAWIGAGFSDPLLAATEQDSDDSERQQAPWHESILPLDGALDQVRISA